MPCLRKYASNTLSAAGAAAVPPWPPFSITAQTTIVGVVEGPVAAPPGLVELERVRIAGDVTSFWAVPGLAGDRRPGSGRRRRRRCRAASGCLVEPVLDGLERGRATPLGVGCWVARSRSTCGGPPRSLGGSTSSARCGVTSVAAVGDHRVEARHLQRRHEQVALADRELHLVAGLPDAVDVPAHGGPP